MKIILQGDLNTRIGNIPISSIVSSHNEDHININGEILRDFCSNSELQINNTVCPHKLQNKESGIIKEDKL